MTFDLKAALRDTDGLVTIPPGRHVLTEPVVFPDRPIVLRGSGIGITELACKGVAPAWLVVKRTDLAGPTEITDLTLTSTGTRAGDAISAAFPYTFACHDGSLLVERVRIRPAVGCETTSAFTRGIVAHGCWSPTISRVWIQGAYNDLTPEAFASAHMDCAIDVGDAQEGKVTYAQIACCQTGVRVSAPQQGKGEGLHVSHSAITNAQVGVRAEGGVFGGWAVPWLSVTGVHAFTTQYGVFATGRSDVVIADNSFCGSHFAAWTIGVYLADKCRNIRIAGNSFWTTRPGQGHGIVVDASRDGTIHDNVIDSSLKIGVWLTASCSGKWKVSAEDVNLAATALVLQGGK